MKLSNLHMYNRFPSLFPVHIDDIHKLGLQRCTSYKESVDVRLLREFLAIRSGHRAAINDPCGLRSAKGHLRLQEVTDLVMSFLRLFSSGDLACADRPHGLVRNHDVAAPVRRILESIRDSLELGENHFCRFPCFPLFESFPNTEDDFETGIQSRLGFFRNKVRRFME